jgi:hypothetical protein
VFSVIWSVPGHVIVARLRVSARSMSAPRLAKVDHGGREGAGEAARDPSEEVASGRLVSLAGI